jgi:hypothetical protein
MAWRMVKWLLVWYSSPFEAFNLIEGIDVEAIEAKIARYEKENAEQIYLSRAKRVRSSFALVADWAMKFQ